MDSIYANGEADFGLLWPLRFFQFSSLLRAHYVQVKWMGSYYNTALGDALLKFRSLSGLGT